MTMHSDTHSVIMVVQYCIQFAFGDLGYIFRSFPQVMISIPLHVSPQNGIKSFAEDIVSKTLCRILLQVPNPAANPYIELFLALCEAQRGTNQH